MGKPMSKSDLISKLAEEHSDKLTRKDVKSVLESLGHRRLQGAQEERDVPGSRLREVRGHQEARHQGAQGHQPVHEGADGVQGEARPQDRARPPGQGRQGRGRLISRRGAWALPKRAHAGDPAPVCPRGG